MAEVSYSIRLFLDWKIVQVLRFNLHFFLLVFYLVSPEPDITLIVNERKQSAIAFCNNISYYVNAGITI